MTPKWQLPGPDAGFFFTTDAQLRAFFRPYLRWLPCRILWPLAIWWYRH
jgi:hypothetical protein